MTFGTQYRIPERFYTAPGSPVKDVYTPRYDVDGNLDLYVSGQEDLYGFIQSHKDSCDIHVILDRFAAGETDALSQVQGFYMDASETPKTYMEILNSVIQGERMFDSLPTEVKQKFGNSFAVWMSAMDKPGFAETMGWITPEQAQTGMTNSQVQDFTGTGAVAPNNVLVPEGGVKDDT